MVRRILITHLVVFTAFFFSGAMMLSSVGYARSVGAPVTLGQGDVSVALEGDYTFDQDLAFDSAVGLPATGNYTSIEITEEYAAFMRADYGIIDNLDAYVRFGVSELEDKYDYNLGSTRYAYGVGVADQKYLWGIGIKGSYDLGNDWVAGVDVQYQRGEYDAVARHTVVSTGITTTMQCNCTKLSGWHVALSAGKRIGSFLPYAGIRYSDISLESEETTGLSTVKAKFKADNNVGVFAGTRYEIDDKWSANFEVRFIDETAVSLATTYKF
jgi:hypothetical protein